MCKLNRFYTGVTSVTFDPSDNTLKFLDLLRQYSEMIQTFRYFMMETKSVISDNGGQLLIRGETVN